MHLPTAVAACALLTAALPATVTAGDCASTKLDVFHAQQTQYDYYQVCAESLVLNFQPSNVTALTPLGLELLSSCGDQACLTALRQLTPVTPDCDVPVGNLKHLWEKQLTMCEKFAAGGITKPEIEDLFKEFAAKGSSAASTLSVAASSVSVVTAVLLAAL